MWYNNKKAAVVTNNAVSNRGYRMFGKGRGVFMSLSHLAHQGIVSGQRRAPIPGGGLNRTFWGGLDTPSKPREGVNDSCWLS
jgi:hypothetical protein